MNALSKFKQLFRKAAKDRSGLSSVEFALILPTMVVTFFGIGEMSLWFQAHHKMTSVASSVGDLVAQDTGIDDTEIGDILACARAIMQPYSETGATVRVSSIVADGAGDTTVEWSDAFNTTPRSPGSAITLPNGMAGPGQSVIMTEVQYTYTSTFGMFLTGGATATDTFYLKPRRSTKVVRL
jgi:Flp pilus assembly protein TadG